MRFLLPILGLSASVYAQACTDNSVRSAASTILIIASDATAAGNGYRGLKGYGISYQILEVPKSGAQLPVLNSTATTGNFGGIVVVSEVAYDYGGSYSSALTAAQWQQLYDYQTAFGIRMVRLDVYPGPSFGAATASANGAGCCDGGEQLMSFTNTSGFPTANLKQGATVSTIGLYHYPATITDASTTWEVASFGPGPGFTSRTTGAVVNRFANGAGNREQMVFFISWASEWSSTSTFLQHGWIHWVTRGLYAGFRRIYFNTQIDDVHLVTYLYEPAGGEYRSTVTDLQDHVTWMADLNSRLPSGSNYIVELAHNGNGNIQAATEFGWANNLNTCPDENFILYDEQASTPTEFKKPLGTGVDIWPTSPARFSSTLACMRQDTLLTWLNVPANRDKYAHMSHTFTHKALNNATYSDTNKEITFNQAWFAATGLDKASVWSPHGLVPPAITGMHNGDAIKAFLDNGIKYVVGDNTRPVLRNPESPYWALTSTVERNGYSGLTIMPRWATTIYFNCDLPQCTLNEWIATSGGSGDFNNLLADARRVNAMHLLNLHQDPFMFHQANLRTDLAPYAVNGKTGRWSILMAWVEVVLDEMTRLTSWPIITKKHDAVTEEFIAREARDKCGYKLDYRYGPGGTTIAGVTVSANGNTCSVPIPVTFPGPVTSTNGGRAEQVGSDPLTVWVNLSGNPVTFTLVNPIPIR